MALANDNWGAFTGSVANNIAARPSMAQADAAGASQKPATWGGSSVAGMIAQGRDARMNMAMADANAARELAKANPYAYSGLVKEFGGRRYRYDGRRWVPAGPNGARGALLPPAGPQSPFPMSPYGAMPW